MSESQEENETLDRELIKSQFDVWSKIFEKKYRFVIDKQDDEESLFKRELISGSILTESMDDAKAFQDGLLGPDFPHQLFGVYKPPHPSEPNEMWMEIEISPRDVYRSKIGSTDKKPFQVQYKYLTERLIVAMSNLGRGYERTIAVSTGDSKSPQLPELKYEPEKSQVILLNSSHKIPEFLHKAGVNHDWQPLNGPTLERLIYLANQVNKEASE